MPKSNSKNNWFSRFFAFFEGKSARKRTGANRRATRGRPRLEQLESRRVFAAVLLDFPGINGDATQAGATATDMELQSFQWGFARTEDGARASLSDPIKFNDLTFTRTTDSASNDLYAQTALQTPSANPARLRLVDNGVNLLRIDLGNSRLTKFETTQGQSESGAISFSNLGFTENVLATPQNAGTPRLATWNLLNGAVTSSAIVGQSNIDNGPNSNPLGIETVMQIGNQKMLINGFKWKADLEVDMSLANPLSGLAKGTNFQITRGVDSATAGLLGSAAGGTIFPEITISDRSLIAGKNQVTMQWKLYDAFFAGFNLEATGNAGAPKNNLELSYGRIELIVNQFNSSGVLSNTETTTWNEAGNVVTSTNDFGTPNPLLLDNPSNPALNPIISSLNFGAPAGSSAAMGRLAYEQIDWSVGKAKDLESSVNAPTTFGAMTVYLPESGNVAAPALLGQLAKRSSISSVNAFEKNNLVPTSALDNFTLSNVYVTGFNVENQGLAETEVNFDLDFRSFTESFTDRTTPATPLITAANFNVQTQASTGALNFGGKTIDTNFELVITEAGVTTSEVPIQSAKWGVSRSVTSNNSGGLTLSKPEQTTFDIEVPRGVHSPGLLAAAVRGTEIDTVSVVRYEVVDVNGTPTKRELYRWDLSEAFITGVGMHMRPGNAIEEVDSISFLPSGVVLTTPNPDVNSNDLVAEWNFITDIGGGNKAGLNELPATNPALRFKLNDASEVSQGIAIDSYQWGATLPVDNATSAGTRPLGNPNPSSLLLKATRQPSTQLLASALVGEARPQAIALPRLSGPTIPSHSYELKVPGLLNGYSYSDAITATNPEIGFTILVGGNTNTAELNVTPIDSAGAAGTPRRVTWNLLNDTTTNFSGFGNFQFATNQLPATTLEIAGSQLAADSYSFGIDNALNQLVGTSTAAAPLAARGNPTAKTFNVTTSLDRATPGLLNAIATKTLIPEIKITERRTINGQLQPWREWVLTNVYVEALANSATASDPQGDVRLELNAASATARYITYNASGTPTTTSRRLNFADVPAMTPIAVSAVSTAPDLVIPIVSRFTDTQISYTTTVLSGANLFDSVSLNASNQLVLNYKNGQRGVGQIRVNGTNAFGLTSSLLVNVTMDDGLADAPAGTDKTVGFDEDTTYIIRTADFGFTDPNDSPANTLTAVRITTLPTLGTLRLSGVAVTAGQVIPVASLNSTQLRYNPALNGHGTNYASFTFQVQDNAATSNLDLSPNLFTFNVFNTNDAPTLTSTSIVMPTVAEDSVNHTGRLVSEIASVITDIDPGAVRGIAIVDAPTTLGTWQYALDGSTWQSLTGSSTNAARLLAADATTRVRFLPNANVSGNSTLRFHAWDRVIGQAGGIGNFTEFAHFRTFSTASANLSVTVTPVNDAPVMSNTIPSLPLIDEDQVYIPGPTSGFPVSTLTGNVTDIDANAQKGIAVLEVTTTGGRWQYSVTNGETWNNFNTVSIASVRLLRDDGSTRIRFLPNSNAFGEARLAYFAWDRTQGVHGGTFDLSGLNTAGGSTAFSEQFLTVSQTIRAINDAPTIVAPATQNTTMDTPVVFSAANGNRLSIADVDGGVLPFEMTITATGGTFTLPTTSGLTFVSGANGQSTFAVRGNVTAINVALGGAIFTPTSRSFGNSILTIAVNDLGNTGSGGAKTTTSVISVPVALPSSVVALGGLTATAPTIRRSGNRSGFTSTPDYYTFTLAAASDVRVNLSGLTDDLDLRVFDAGGLQVGQSLFFGTTIENILMTALPAGTYLIDVRRAVASAYDLTISTATNSDDLITQASLLPTLNATTLPTIRQSAIGTSADLQDYHRFELTTASALRINLSNLSQDADIQLLDAAGRVIQSANTSDNTIESILTSTLAAGTYYLRVFAGSGPLTSNYDLTISMNTASDDLLTNATSFGILGLKGSERRTGNVAVGTDLQDYYVFAGGGDIAISLSGLTSDVDVQVLDRFGRVLAQSTNGGNTAESINVNVPPGSGSIYIRVFAFAGASNYVLEARNNSNAANADDLLSTATVLPTPLTSLTRTGSVGGTGSTGDPQDYYRFELTSVRNIALTLTGLTADLDVELLDQFGNLLFFSRNGSTNNESINIANLAVGTYFIRIHPFGAAISNYTLGLAVS